MEPPLTWAVNPLGLPTMLDTCFVLKVSNCGPWGGAGLYLVFIKWRTIEHSIPQAWTYCHCNLMAEEDLPFLGVEESTSWNMGIIGSKGNKSHCSFCPRLQIERAVKIIDHSSIGGGLSPCSTLANEGRNWYYCMVSVTFRTRFITLSFGLQIHLRVSFTPLSLFYDIVFF